MPESWKVREQFNKQATNFDNWSMTQDERTHDFLIQFLDIEAKNDLLDFACGTGAFAIYAAQRVKAVWGIDISDKMIEVAVTNAKQRHLENINFIRCDVEKTPFESERFSFVCSKAAYHHMKNYQTVFQEMKRCCKNNGRICIQDIITYDNLKLDEFFEQLELEIDSCHHKTLSKQAFVDLYKQNDIEICRILESVSELNFFDYVNHAVQTEQAKDAIDELIGTGLNDPLISQCFVTKNDTLFWKRKVLSIAGYKK